MYELFIIDAKMYQYGFTKKIEDLPETTSMQKQITYGDYVKKIVGNMKIRNVFVLPYDKLLVKFKQDPNIYKLLDGDMAYIGIAYVSWREQSEEYDKIYSFLVDFNFLLNSYQKNDETCIEQLCNKIDQVIKTNPKWMQK